MDKTSEARADAEGGSEQARLERQVDDGPGEPLRVASPIAARAAELRLDALKAVDELVERKKNAQANLAAMQEDLLEACKVAAQVGATREQLAGLTGLSESTIGNWVRPEKD